MLFHIYCIDKLNKKELRNKNREAHLNYMKKFKNQVLVAGPMLSDDGNSMIGSIFIINFSDRSNADDFCSNDPYQKAGLFKSSEIRLFRKVVP